MGYLEASKKGAAGPGHAPQAELPPERGYRQVPHRRCHRRADDGMLPLLLLSARQQEGAALHRALELRVALRRASLRLLHGLPELHLHLHGGAKVCKPQTPRASGLLVVYF